MRYSRQLFFLTFLFICVLTYSQTQKGYVKTLGRPEKRGIPLSGVSVRVKGEHNPVLSKDDGTFNIVMTGKKNGDAYALQEVLKKGYELNETGVIGRQYAYSDKVPLTIVMVSTEQLQADKQRIENNAYKVAEKNYKVKLELLEKQKAENFITEEQYRLNLMDLQDKFEKYQLLIDGLAEHYAHVDYDDLNGKEREINICIENGELERADSLIKTMFDPIDVLKRNKAALTQLNRQITEANTMIDKANEDMDAVLKQQEKDAEHLYQLYTIAFSLYDNQKAELYIETRAGLDTTNVEWLYDAGLFSQHTGNYEKALSLYETGLRNAISQFGEQSNWCAKYYNNIGLVYINKDEHLTALTNFIKSLGITESLNNMDSISLRTLYGNVGLSFQQIGRYEQAQTYLKKAMMLLPINNNHQATISILVTLGMNYFETGNHSLAIITLKSALNKSISLLGSNNIYEAKILNNLGMIYSEIGNYDNALLCLSKALDINIETIGAIHPDVAQCYVNLSTLYGNKNDFAKAMEYAKHAMNIAERIGEQHSIYAITLNNIGACYKEQDNNEEALLCYERALAILKKLYGERNTHVGMTYYNIGMAYCNLCDYSIALSYIEKAEATYQSLDYSQTADLALCHHGYGTIYYEMNDFQKALEYFQQSLQEFISVYGERHSKTAMCYYDIGCSYSQMENYDKSLDYFKKALPIEIAVYGECSFEVRDTYFELGKGYANKDDYQNAIEFFKKALDLSEEQFGEKSKRVLSLCLIIGEMYFNMDDIENAELFFSKGKDLIINNMIEKEEQLYYLLEIVVVCYKRENYYEAIECQKLVVGLDKEIYGEHHIKTGRGLRDLGTLYANIHETQSALSYLRQSLSILIPHLGEDHSDIISIKQDIETIKKQLP